MVISTQHLMPTAQPTTPQNSLPAVEAVPGLYFCIYDSHANYI